MKRGFPLKSAPGCPALNLMEEIQKMKYEGKGLNITVKLIHVFAHMYVCACVCVGVRACMHSYVVYASLNHFCKLSIAPQFHNACIVS